MNDWFFLHFHRIALITLTGLGLLIYWFMGGCAGEPVGASITGVVTSNGKPVVGGTVSVLASDNRIYQGTIGPDGRYEVPGVPNGPVRVAVSSPNPRPTIGPPGVASMPPPAGLGKSATTTGVVVKTGSSGSGKQTTWMMPMEGPPVPAGPALPHHANWFPIPGKYADPLASGFTGHASGRTGLDLKAD
jgi:hypothetical protein